MSTIDRTQAPVEDGPLPEIQNAPASRGGPPRPPRLGRLAKRAMQALGVLPVLLLLGGTTHVTLAVHAFDASMRKAYDAPLPDLARSGDPRVIARGRHLVESVGGCTGRSCHGADLGGGEPFELGPLATIAGPNIAGARLDGYSDGQLARLITRGIKSDGRGVLFMPVEDFGWLPPEDVAAMVSYLRTLPSVARATGPSRVTVLGKVLDRQGSARLDVARRVAEEPTVTAPPRGETAAYGALLSRACTMCHGEGLSGGPIPGAPSSVPVPLNLTPDTTGLREWTFDDFDRLLTAGVRKGGARLNPFMPLDTFGRYDDVEKRALWAYLTSLPARPLGDR